MALRQGAGLHLRARVLPRCMKFVAVAALFLPTITNKETLFESVKCEVVLKLCPGDVISSGEARNNRTAHKKTKKKHGVKERQEAASHAVIRSGPVTL